MMEKYLLIYVLSILVGTHALFGQIAQSSIQDKLNRVAELEENGNLKEASRYLNEIASDYWDQKDYSAAIEHFKHSLELNKQLKNGNGVSGIYSNLGMIYSDIGQYEQARVYMEKNLQMRRREGKKKRILTSILNLSVVLNNLKKYEESIVLLKEAMRFAQELNEPEKMRACYGMLAETYEKQGDLEQTRVYFELYRSFHEMIQRKKEALNQKKLAEAKAQTEILEVQKKNQLLELELQNQELALRQQQLKQKQEEIKEIELVLVQFDSTNRELIMNADKKDLVILTLEEQKRNRKLELEQARMRQYILQGLMALFLIFGIILFRHSRQKSKFNTKLRQQNQAIIQGQKDLEHSNERLQEAVNRAEAASTAKSQFLSTISHEIRTPMNSVIGFTNLLRMDNPLPHQDQYLKTLEFSANHLLGLINDVLDFSKIEAGKLDLDQALINLEELMNHLQRTFQPKAEESGIELLLIPKSEIKVMVMGDDVRINQILTNLVSNAIKFTSEGSVKIEYGVIQETKDELRCNITVIDTGIGISESKMQLIFEQFTQANSDTTRKFGGTGLGLTISKHLVELMGGRIWVESEEGVGSSFSIELPFQKGEPIQTGENPITQKSEDTTETFVGMQILVADDNPINVVIVEEFLQRWEVEVDVAENGQEALEMVRENKGKYHLVLMDLQMPVMDGYEASMSIREDPDPFFQDLPIIALTASASTEVQSKAQQSKLNGYLSKPFNPKDLFEVLKQHYQSTPSIFSS